jgi:hypothetical protein
MRSLFLGEDRKPVATLDPEVLQDLGAREVARRVLAQLVEALRQTLQDWPPPDRPPLTPPLL